MENGNLILAKKMAQSIIKDGFVRDMDLFNDISVVLKQSIDDPEAKSLLNRINLIKISGAKPAPAPPQNVAPPVQEKVNPPVQPVVPPPVQERVNPPVQPRVVPPVQERVNPPVQSRFVPPVQPKVVPPVQARNVPVQPKNAAPVQSKNGPVQNKAGVPAQPKIVAPNQDKTNISKQNISADLEQESAASGRFPAALWLLPIFLLLPGGIIALLIARKKPDTKGTGLLIVGIITSIIAGVLIYLSTKYTIVA
jgi:hypothetical protein